MRKHVCSLFLALRFNVLVYPTDAFPVTKLGRIGRNPTSSAQHSALKATEKPSVAIVGSGAVGAYYGSRLWETGAYDVKFFMRGEHYQKSSSEGLNITSVHGDIFIPPEDLQAFTETKEMGKVDWVIVALKSFSLESIPALIYPLLEPGRTRVLAIMNGLIEDDLIQLLKEHAGEDVSDKDLHCCAALYGGMALVCSNRLGPGRIDHSYAGLLSGGVAACDPEVTQEENQKAYEELWAPTKIEIAYEPSLLSGRWRKVRSLQLVLCVFLRFISSQKLRFTAV